MKMNKLFHLTLLIFLTISGCGKKNSVSSASDALNIRLSTDSNSVELYQLPEYLFEEVDGEISMDSVWHNFFAVYEETQDLEMRDFQPALEGKYELTDSILRFTPDSGLKKGDYFARCYTPHLLQEPVDIVSSKDINSNAGFIEMKFTIN